MRRISPPLPEIELYTTGFEGLDLLGRSPTAKRLTELLDEIDEPLVVAIDGDWVQGKSFFLKCWAGAHLNEFDGKSEFVYLDAYARDFLQDPLVALVSEISERFTNAEEPPRSIDRLKNYVGILARPAMRISLAAASASVSEFTGPIIDSLIKKSAGEVESKLGNLWEAEGDRRSAIDGFRAALTELTTSESRNLIIVIDELDRCRPSYAIELLEITKHFFEVPNVHFVLGVNLRELEASIRTRYGLQSDAKAYLAKHIKLTVELPKTEESAGATALTSVSHMYFKKQVIAMSVDEEFSRLVFATSGFLQPVVSLRDANSLLSLIGLIPFENGFPKRFQPGYRIGLAILVALKHCRPDLYSGLLQGKILGNELLDALVKSDENSTREGRELEIIKKVVSAFGGAESIDDGRFPGLFEFGDAPGSAAFRRLASNYLETFRRFET